MTAIAPGMIERVDDLKRLAAIRALEHVRDGMVVGLGTGTTADLFIDGLAEMVRGGLRIVGVPTSDRTTARAQRSGIPLSTLEQHPRLSLAVDGADEIERSTLALIKGRGGALLREKIVASAADTVIIIAVETKLVDQLGAVFPVPVAVVPFGWRRTVDHLAALGSRATLRLDADTSTPFVSDDGCYIVDCMFDSINPPATARAIKSVTGVVEHGLFVGLANIAIVGTRRGAVELRPTD